MRVNIQGLIDNAKCYQMVRQLRWLEQVECPHCHATQVTKNGHDETQSDRQRYLFRMCNRAFDDLTGTEFAGHHQPLSVWMLTNTKRSATGTASMPVTRTVTGITKFTSTRWRVVGRCCEVGSALTVGFHRNDCQPTSVFSSLSTTPAYAEIRYSEASSKPS